MLAAAAILVLAACGGGEDDAGQENDAEPPQRVVVDGDGSEFDPQAIYDRVSGGVVTVRSSFDLNGEPVGGDEEEENPFTPEIPQQGQGSGFVISEEGEIVTNAHVVTNGSSGGGLDIRSADEVFVQFADRNQVEAEIVGYDPFADIALLRVEPDGLDLRPLDLGSAAELEVGAPVAAIGSPFGQQQSLSTGVVSATDRSVQSLTRFTIDGAIQTDASINPGNSGGPLLDAGGEVIGVNQQINTRTGASEGVGFAVPVELARRAVDQLRETGEVAYAFMGVETRSVYPQLAERLGIDAEAGALIVNVSPGSPAEDAGLRSGDEEITFQGVPYEIGGDVIVAVEGEPILADNDLPRRVALLEPGTQITLEVIRDGEREEIELTLGERPSDVE